MGNKPGLPTPSKNTEQSSPVSSPDYRFINLEITNTANNSFGGSGQEMMSSTVDSFYPMLSQHYSENFRLLSFYKKVSKVDSRTDKVSNHAIYYRVRDTNPNEGWRLQMDKSVYEGLGTMEATSQLFKTMTKHTALGGRLICLEKTEHQDSQGSLGDTGLDIFFDMPTHTNPQIPEYHIVPLLMEIKPGSGKTVCSEWASFLDMNLCIGMRLIDIFVDNSHVPSKGSYYANTIWFFENPDYKTGGMKPLYEGTVVDHCVTLQGGFSGVTANCGLEQKILEMASYGWDLACILRTPEQHRTGEAENKAHFIIFFQRKLFPETTFNFQ